MKLLLISNSTNFGEAYLDYPKNNIKDFLGTSVKTALFIPYAGVTMSFDEYTERVQNRFQEIGYHITPIHTCSNPVKAIEMAETIVVGGGNTFQLIKMIHENKLIEPIRKKVLNGTPFVGWSAGSNVACPTIKTTNDMPIVQPPSFDAFNLVPFQINPHYLDASPDGHAGETREQRIMEFLVANPAITVVGLRESTMLQIIDNKISLIGPRKARIFKHNQMVLELSSTDDLSFLLK